MFVVTQFGHHDKPCVGIFTTLDLAAQSISDTYEGVPHNFEVTLYDDNTWVVNVNFYQGYKRKFWVQKMDKVSAEAHPLF